MYIPTPFAENDFEKLQKFMRDYPFATLVSSGAGGLEANHLPLFLEVQPGRLGLLQGHIAKANPLWQSIANGEKVLVIFHGPAAYISPSWYPSKKINGKVVPTWNYLAVHVHGSINFIEQAGWKNELLTKLTQANESDRSKPWSISDAPPDYIHKQLDAIVGFEIAIEQIQGKWKISQNQTAENRQGVLSGLAEEENRQGSLLQTMREYFS